MRPVTVSWSAIRNGKPRLFIGSERQKRTYKEKMKTNLLTAAIASLLATPAVLASPAINGNIISWPDDGWYQVQSTTDYTTVCEGGTQCQVDPGTYIVVNHSTGERFEGVQVVGTQNSGSILEQTLTEVSVDGSTIRWPDNGWYQVQSAHDYSALCEGGTQCSVSDGTYNVINLSTGERFDNIVVQQTNANSGAMNDSGNNNNSAAVEVTGDTISWPDDGWYQVQSATDYSTQCEGGSSCRVADGVYTVINHSTGERFDNLVVATGGNLVDNNSSNNGSSSGDNQGGSSDTGSLFPARVDFYNGFASLQSAPVYSLAGETLITGQTPDRDGDGIAELQFFSAHSSTTDCDALTIVPSTRTTNENLNSNDLAFSLRLISTYGQLTGQSGRTCDELSVANAIGDINGDGIGDIATRVIYGSYSFGPVAVIFGSSQSGTIDVASLNGNNGFLLTQTENQNNLRSAGDVNGDGYDDLVFLSSGEMGAEQKVLAGSASFPAIVDAQAVSSSQALLVARVDGRDLLRNAGDINGDGFADLMTVSRAGSQPAILYGSANLSVRASSQAELPMPRFIDYCSGGFCSWRPVGDFDADGFDDIVVSRFSCGYGYHVHVLYGSESGIAPRADILDYPASERTRIVEEAGAQCHSSQESGINQYNFNGDDANDLVMGTRTLSSAVVLGTPGVRLDTLSTDDMDGTTGFQFTAGPASYSVVDINRDGFDDLLSNGSFLAGHARRLDSAGPGSIVVQQGNDVLTVHWQRPISGTPSSYRVSINDSFVADTTSSETSITFSDTTNGVESLMTIEALSDSGVILGSNQRVIPARRQVEDLVATIHAPRLVSMEFNSETSVARYSQYLVWRDGMPLARVQNGARSYWDGTVEAGRTYTYHITPDYLLGESLDASRLQEWPVRQRQSNTIEVTMPLQ